jgi:hypothetical protein
VDLAFIDCMGTARDAACGVICPRPVQGNTEPLCSVHRIGWFARVGTVAGTAENSPHLGRRTTSNRDGSRLEDSGGWRKPVAGEERDPGKAVSS